MQQESINKIIKHARVPLLDARAKGRPYVLMVSNAKSIPGESTKMRSL